MSKCKIIRADRGYSLIEAFRVIHNLQKLNISQRAALLRMHFGFLVGTGWLPDEISAIAQRLEEVGFDAMMIPDHTLRPVNFESKYPYTETGEMVGKAEGHNGEQLTTCAFVAARTKKIRLVPFVLVAPIRNPLLTAKMLATVDDLSNGRLSVCLGVGWLKEEFEALGISNFGYRGAFTDEFVRVLKEVWTHDNPEFHGKYIQFPSVTFSPKPVQKPHPPIWIGGESQGAIKRAGELGDGWFPVGDRRDIPLKTFDEIRAAKERLDEHRLKGISTQPHYEYGYRIPRGILERETSEVMEYLHNLEKIGITYVGCTPRLQGRTSFDDTLKWIDNFADRIMSKYKGA